MPQDTQVKNHFSSACDHHGVGRSLPLLIRTVQPCQRRIFGAQAYEQAGAVVQEDLSEAGIDRARREDKFIVQWMEKASRWKIAKSARRPHPSH